MCVHPPTINSGELTSFRKKQIKIIQFYICWEPNWVLQGVCHEDWHLLLPHNKQVQRSIKIPSFGHFHRPLYCLDAWYLALLHNWHLCHLIKLLNLRNLHRLPNCLNRKHMSLHDNQHVHGVRAVAYTGDRCQRGQLAVIVAACPACSASPASGSRRLRRRQQQPLHSGLQQRRSFVLETVQ